MVAHTGTHLSRSRSVTAIAAYTSATGASVAAIAASTSAVGARVPAAASISGAAVIPAKPVDDFVVFVVVRRAGSSLKLISIVPGLHHIRHAHRTTHVWQALTNHARVASSHDGTHARQ